MAAAQRREGGKQWLDGGLDRRTVRRRSCCLASCLRTAWRESGGPGSCPAGSRDGQTCIRCSLRVASTTGSSRRTRGSSYARHSSRRPQGRQDVAPAAPATGGTVAVAIGPMPSLVVRPASSPRRTRCTCPLNRGAHGEVHVPEPDSAARRVPTPTSVAIVFALDCFREACASLWVGGRGEIRDLARAVGVRTKSPEPPRSPVTRSAGARNQSSAPSRGHRIPVRCRSVRSASATPARGPGPQGAPAAPSSIARYRCPGGLATS